MNARRSTMPPLVTCTNCRLPYYQTSAAHVCSEYRKEKTTMSNDDIRMAQVAAGEAAVVQRLRDKGLLPPEHEPAARGEGDDDMDIEVSQEVWLHVYADADCWCSYHFEEDGKADRHLTKFIRDDIHTALVEQRDRLLVVARDALRFREEVNGKCDHDELMTKLCTQCEIRAAIDAIEHEQGGGA